MVGSAASFAASPVSCVEEQSFPKLESSFWRAVSEQPAAPVTMTLPGDSSAQLYFHQAMAPDSTYRVFEVDGPLSSKSTGEERDVLSVQQAPATAPDQFKPANSVELQVGIPPDRSSLWYYRYFVVLACNGPAITNWGFVAARVSDPAIARIVCALTMLTIYFVGMLAVYRSRLAPHPLAEKYPAIFASKVLRWVDFLNPIHLAANQFNQASVQKLQVLVFSFLVGGLVLYLVLTTGTLVSLSPTVVELLGISGVGAAAAQATFSQRTRLSFENWAWLQTRKVIKEPAEGVGPRWRDLVLTNREFDIYKLQTIIFSVGVAFEMALAGSTDLSTFSIPETTLGILGLSQVVYIGGILVRPPSIGDLDDALTKLRSAGETVKAAKLQGTDTDANGKLLAPPPGPVAINAQRQYDDLADKVAIMIETALEVEVDRSKL
jgi:hypothetical protein